MMSFKDILKLNEISLKNYRILNGIEVNNAGELTEKRKIRIIEKLKELLNDNVSPNNAFKQVAFMAEIKWDVVLTEELIREILEEYLSK